MTYWNKDPDSRMSEYIQQQLIRAAPLGIFGHKNMSKELAIRLRTIIAALLKTENKRDWVCAVKPSRPSSTNEDWEVHLFSPTDNASVFCDLVYLASFIESMGIGVLFIANKYDLGTTEPKKVKSWELF